MTLSFSRRHANNSCHLLVPVALAVAIPMNTTVVAVDMEATVGARVQSSFIHGQTRERVPWMTKRKTTSMRSEPHNFNQRSLFEIEFQESDAAIANMATEVGSFNQDSLLEMEFQESDETVTKMMKLASTGELESFNQHSLLEREFDESDKAIQDAISMMTSKKNNEEDEPILSTADLRPGDVLLFTPFSGDLESYLIAALTGSTVSHAAMVNTNTSQLIEDADLSPDGGKGVMINDIQARFANRTVYVRRFRDSTSNNKAFMNPVLKVANSRVGSSPYAEYNVYMIAVLSIFRNFAKPSGPLYWYALSCIELCTAALVSLVNKRHYSADETPMVCSQFVFQSFHDAGPRYELKIPELMPRDSVESNLLQHMIEKLKNDPEDTLSSELEKDGPIQKVGRFISNTKLIRSLKAMRLTKFLSASASFGNLLLPSHKTADDHHNDTRLQKAMVRFAKAFHALSMGTEDIASISTLEALTYLCPQSSSNFRHPRRLEIKHCESRSGWKNCMLKTLHVAVYSYEI